MLAHSSFVYTLAGIAFFIFGMDLASKNLQILAANRIKGLISKLSDKPYLGVIVGVLMTVIIQSSGAVTSMLVGLGSAGVVALPQVMSVILGSAIGSTLTVQLLSLNVAQFGLPLFTISFIIYFISKKRVIKSIASVLMGFGLIFWGLEVITFGTSSLRDSNVFIGFLDYLKDFPLIAILATALFTAVVHSSAVTIGFAMGLAASGMLSLYDAIFWVYGANIGTTATALIASAGGNFMGKQVAWAHCLFKVVGVAIFFFFTSYFSDFLISDLPQRDIANAHTIFNIIAVILFYPFIKYGVKVIQYLFPPSKSEDEFSVKYLGRGDFQSVSVAVAHAEREVLRMADIVFSMIRDSIELFKGEDLDLIADILEKDNRVDLLNKEINLFVASYMEQADPGSEIDFLRLMTFSTDLESVGDVIDNSLLKMAEKKQALKVDFSPEGWEEIKQIYEETKKLSSLSITCFQRQDKELAGKIVYSKRLIRRMEKDFRIRHLERLIAGKKETMNTSSIHMDILSEYRRIVGLMSNHVYALLKDSDKYLILPRGSGEDED